MKSQTRLSHKKLVAIILVLLVLGFGAFKTYGHFHKTAADTQNTGPTAEEVKTANTTDNQTKKDFVENNDKSTEPTTTTTVPNSSVAIDMSATHDGNSVTVIAKLPGVSSGTCTLVVTNGSKTATYSAAVIYQPEFSSCAGFSVPVSEVGNGTWSLTLSLSGASTGNKTISLAVN